jgi:putative transcriptional regulator
MIRVDLDVMMAKRKMSLTELSQRVGITMANLSILKNGHARAVRMSTLEAICRVLKCQPGISSFMKSPTKSRTKPDIKPTEHA